MNAVARTPITRLVLDAEDTLRLLADPARPSALTAFAEAIGRTKNNQHATFKSLIAAGLALMADGRHVPDLTGAGRSALAALDRAAAEAGDLGPGGLSTWPHDRLRLNPENPRELFEDIAGLADTIRECGILMPVLATAPDANGVRTLKDGDRRWKAVELLVAAGALPADHPIPFREVAVSAGEAAFIALVTTHRRPLDPLEEARAYATLADERNWSAREVAHKTGRAPEGSDTGVRAVQQRIKVAREATPQTIARYQAGELTWEQLRDSVQAKGAPEAAPPSPPAAAKAPAGPTLTPAQVLILHEVEAAIRARPELKAPLGPTTGTVSGMSLAGRDDTARLVAEGMLSFGSYPWTVSLLKLGAAWLASQPGGLMEVDYRLQRARRDAGLSDLDIAGLEANGEYATKWLNLPKPPPPIQLSPADALVLVEIADLTRQQWVGAEVAFDIDQDVLEPLRARGLIGGGKHPDYSTCRYYVTVSTHRVGEALTAACPGWSDKATRPAALAALRIEVLGEAAAAALDGRYATVWLNGPFPLSPAAETTMARRAEERAQQKAEAADRETAGREARAATAAVDLLAATDPKAAGAALAARLQKEFPLPWRYVHQHGGSILDANGVEIETYDLDQLLVVAMNLAAGVAHQAALDTFPDDPEDEDPDEAEDDADLEAALEEEPA